MSLKSPFPEYTMMILISFIGNNDCYPDEKAGAILSILQQRQFDKVYLLYNHARYFKPGSEILRYCQKYFPKLTIYLQEAIAHNPVDYNTVYPAMYEAVKEILKDNDEAQYTISLTSGTPTMHACWVLLRQGGVIDAKLIQISRESEISEVTFKLDDFPDIKNVDEMKVVMTKLARENINLKNQFQLKHDDIIGESPDILRIKEQIGIFSDTDIPIFIQGESGTGKELVAEAVHYNSSRKGKSLVKVNCGAIPSELFESEFFGHKKGSFTGAVSDKDGKFKQADGGTIFLDEIADLPQKMQVKLLHILQNGTFVPVGGTTEEQVDVRIISATNKDIRQMVKASAFREDLFYRLVHTEIKLPPLRDRRNDKVLLAQYIMKQLNHKYGKRKILDKSAIALILKHDWPGNIRQLKNALETAFVYPENKIEAGTLNIIEIESGLNHVILPEEGIDLNNEILPKYYKAALKKSDGNAEKAAKLLNLSPHTFRARLRTLESKNIYVIK